MIKHIKSLTKHKSVRLYGVNTLWLLVEKIFRMIAGVFVGIWVARYLGPAQFGLLSYTQSFVGLFAAVATLGLDGIIVREILKDKTRRDVLLGTAFVLRLAGAIVVVAILGISVLFSSGDLLTKQMIMLIGFATFFQSFGVVDYYFQSAVMGKFIVVANVFCLFLSSIVKVVLIYTKSPLIYFAYNIFFDSIVLGVCYVYLYCYNGLSIKKWKFDLTIAKELLRSSLFFTLSALLISLYMKIDQVMLKELIDNEAVGLYAAAVRLSEVWYFLPVIISSSLYPAIENAKKISISLYYRRFQALFDISVLSSILIIIPTLFLNDWVVSVLYGEKFKEAASVLIIHILSLVFACTRVSSEYWVLSENLIYFEVFKTFLGLLANVILNIVLIKVYGIQGAAIATLLAMMLTGYVSYAFHKKGKKIFQMMTKSLFLIETLKKINNYFLKTTNPGEM